MREPLSVPIPRRWRTSHNGRTQRECHACQFSRGSMSQPCRQQQGTLGHTWEVPLGACTQQELSECSRRHDRGGEIPTQVCPVTGCRDSRGASYAPRNLHRLSHSTGTLTCPSLEGAGRPPGSSRWDGWWFPGSWQLNSPDECLTSTPRSQDGRKKFRNNPSEMASPQEGPTWRQQCHLILPLALGR